MKKDYNPKTKKENIEEIVGKIKERFGEGAIMRMKEVDLVDVDTISTGSISLDLALGTGGIPRGRIIEIFGPESTGKSTLALHIVAEAQKMGGTAAFIDAEHALDPEYAKKIGVNIDELLISQPDSGEQALQIVETLVRSGTVDVIVIDSVAALAPKTEIEGEMGDVSIGLQARLMSSALRKLSGIISKTKTSVIFINQTRMKIGVYFGNPETTSGGLALKFYASIRIDLRRIAQIKQKDQIIGSRIKAKIVKNKVAVPFKTAEFSIYYDEGISTSSDILDNGLKYEVIKKQGNSYVFEENKLGIGFEAARNFLKENLEIAKKITERIKKIVIEQTK